MADSVMQASMAGRTNAERRIRVLIVDDSGLIRRLISRVLEGDPAFEVVGTASNGVIALEKAAQLHPDAITLDIEMPEMDGLETLTHLQRDFPKIKVIMFSTLTERGARSTIDSLLRGASDYVTKPSNTGQFDEAESRLRTTLLPRLKSLCGASIAKPLAAEARAMAAPVVSAAPALSPMPPRMGSVASRRAPHYRVVAIGLSTGGPAALSEVLAQMPGDFPLPILVTQHMPPLFTQFLADRLNARSALNVMEAREGQEVEPGKVYIAPGDYHMRVVVRDNKTLIALDQGPPENSCRPAVDVMMRSVSDVFGADVVAAILTGMGHDGRRGVEQVRRQGGYVIAQDNATSVVWGMPGAVVEAGLAHQVVGLHSIADALLAKVRAA
ncbi:protein-glutamate methylesterase/protein-glutamine glutaminase [Silvibacterium sp.]|uniref:protein-glutamate methylesterase/protein-glutamine glutaminase n=1 Tax=Silvibacterium sp. TaxID=1964179 RepID=UPI0039E25259